MVLVAAEVVFGLIVLRLLWWAMEPLRAANCRERESERDLAEREAWLLEQADDTVPELSIVIPAYNEEQRLPSMLKELGKYLQTRKALQYEIILVDDGSLDNTAKTGKKSDLNLRVARLSKNRGKGGAVREGAYRARGKRILLADADGATRIHDLERLEAALNAFPTQEPAIAFGSRAHLIQSDVVARRSPIRNLLMNAFHLVVRFVGGVHNIRDTQCGFKLFNRAALSALLSIHLERWAFDVELLHIAQRLHYHLLEIPVDWTEVPGSKLSILRDSIRMARDIACLRFAYVFGIWRIPSPENR